MDKFTIIANGAENRRGKNQAVARKIADYLEKTSEGMCDFTCW